MKPTERLFRQMREGRLIALLSPSDRNDCLTAFELCRDEGITLEVAFRSEHAVAGIALVRETYPEALILAGTVMTAEQAEAAIEAGAAGIVSADFIPAVVDVCVEHDIMCVPGGLSDAGKQLVCKAEGYGCSLEELREHYPWQWIYKLFPAFTEGSSAIHLPRAWRGPWRDLTIVYTGGVSIETLPRALHADPGGIFCASALLKDLDDREKAAAEIGKWKEMISGGARTGPHAPAAPKVERDGGEAAEEKKGIGSTVVTFGELMMRLSPPAGIRLRTAGEFAVHFGGAAANVAVSLARFGHTADFVTLLPDSDPGENALRALREQGVVTHHIVRKGTRLGIYFLEHGSGPRPSKVVYDRAGSSFSGIDPSDLDWERILEGAEWFHWTGITPALGQNVTATLLAGLEAARSMGVRVSVDLNYRSRLWNTDEAERVMTGLMPFVDLLIANEEDPASVFGIKIAGTDVESGDLDVSGYERAAGELRERFSLDRVAITLRESISASENNWSACLLDGDDFHISPVYHVPIIDRVGAGDAFAAGLIHGILTGMEAPDALNFGVAASCLKHSICGDFNLVDTAEVERLAGGSTSGRVVR